MALRAETEAPNKPRNNRFSGECFYCKKPGHRKRECKKWAKDQASGQITGSSGQSSPRNKPQGASTGPLPTPGGNTRAEGANKTTEEYWTTIVSPEESLNLQGLQAITEECQATYIPPTGSSLTWMVDSGCSRHMTFYREAFIAYYRLPEPININTATGTRLQAIGEGTIELQVVVQGVIKPITLTKVLYVPGLSGSLISVI